MRWVGGCADREARLQAGAANCSLFQHLRLEGQHDGVRAVAGGVAVGGLGAGDRRRPAYRPGRGVEGQAAWAGWRQGVGDAPAAAGGLGQGQRGDGVVLVPGLVGDGCAAEGQIGVLGLHRAFCAVGALALSAVLLAFGASVAVAGIVVRLRRGRLRRVGRRRGRLRSGRVVGRGRLGRFRRRGGRFGRFGCWRGRLGRFGRRRRRFGRFGCRRGRLGRLRRRGRDRRWRHEGPGGAGVAPAAVAAVVAGADADDVGRGVVQAGDGDAVAGVVEGGEAPACAAVGAVRDMVAGGVLHGGPGGGQGAVGPRHRHAGRRCGGRHGFGFGFSLAALVAGGRGLDGRAAGGVEGHALHGGLEVSGGEQDGEDHEQQDADGQDAAGAGGIGDAHRWLHSWRAGELPELGFAGLGRVDFSPSFRRKPESSIEIRNYGQEIRRLKAPGFPLSRE